MDDRFTKYTKLYFLIFGSILAFNLVVALLIGIAYGAMNIISSKPLDIFYAVMIMILPPALFTSVYYIFIGRTKKHPAKIIKIISQALMVIAFCICIAVLIADVVNYFKSNAPLYIIDRFYSYKLAFLAGNVALLFIIAIAQAFSTPKEDDWIEKRKKKNEGSKK